MKLILKAEEFTMLLLGIFAFRQLDFAWWWFPLLFLLPDLGMLGYIFNNKTGAFFYNLFHHRGLAIMLWIFGFGLQQEFIQLIAVILFAHVAFDRMLGYGLKYEKGFKFTHLGQIGR